MSDTQITKEYFSTDPQIHEINKGWLEFFENNLEYGQKILISQNLCAPEFFHYSDKKETCSLEEIKNYFNLLENEPANFRITFRNEKYAFITKKDEDDETSPVYFFVSTTEVSDVNKEKIILLVKFLMKDIVFVGRALKSKQSEAIDFVQEAYRNCDEEDEEEEEE